MAEHFEFPILRQMNALRCSAYNATNNLHEEMQDPPRSLPQRAAFWIAHKALSVVCLPANLVGVGVGCGGMITTACTLGAIKVAVFAATLGHKELTFSTGFRFFARRSATAIGEAVQNIAEVLCDLGRLSVDILDKLKQCLVALKLDHLWHYIVRFGDFLGRRLEAGFSRAMQDEPGFGRADKVRLPFPITEINSCTLLRSYRNPRQSACMWLEHKVLSLLNLPLNAGCAVVTGALCVAGVVALVAKGVFTAVTTIPIPIPTCVYYTGSMAAQATGNTFRTLQEVGADLIVLIYRVSEALKVTDALATLAQVIAAAPRLIVS